MESIKSSIDNTIIEKARTWLTEDFDETTRTEVKQLIEDQSNELVDAFYKDLDFGTGGLRGIMGVGSNRVNRYTIGLATQGFANYLNQQFADTPIKAVIGFDCRNNSSFFAKITADVLSANGIEVFLFKDLRPTPEISFAIRELNCQGGVIITASHNPKEYNGYKVYWNDGGQLVAPHDTNVIKEVQKISHINEVNFKPNPSLIHELGEDIDNRFLDRVLKLSLSPDVIQKNNDLKIVFTSLHGTSITLVPQLLEKFGFKNVHVVEEQANPDGDFPTVHSPNPEEKAALNIAIDHAKKLNADIVMGTDPDADRVGISVKNLEGQFELLNGNQTAALLVSYMLSTYQEKKLLNGKQFIAKTIVTSELLEVISRSYEVPCYNTLTGFKFIADLIKEKEGKQSFIVGGEESYGYLIGDFVRDKDAISSCAILAEIAAWVRENGTTIYDELINIYLKYGFYKERLLSITKKGKKGAEEILQMILDLRNTPPEFIDNSRVITIKDYKSSIIIHLPNRETTPIDLPKSNVLQFITEDGTQVTARPSGTEPKIKFYFSTRMTLDNKDDFEVKNKLIEEKLDRIVQSLNLNQ